MLRLTPSRLLAASGLTGCVAAMLVAITSTAGGCAKGSELGDGLEGGVIVGLPPGSGSGSSRPVIVGGGSSSTMSGGSSSSEACTGTRMTCTNGCTDTATDPDNCGFCGNSCNGSACNNSQCATSSSSCPGAEEQCSGECTDLTSDPDNCGFCGDVCDSGECNESECSPGFDAGGFDAGDFDSGGGFDAGGFGETCSHSPCMVGIALVDGCDDDVDETVSSICEGDQPQCCTSGWTQSCVDEATTDCGTGTVNDFCTDPGC